jgi:hypothetical protein
VILSSANRSAVDYDIQAWHHVEMDVLPIGKQFGGPVHCQWVWADDIRLSTFVNNIVTTMN